MVNLKFWKKDDFSDFKLPPMTAGSDLGLGTGFGTNENTGGLDLSGGFQTGAGLPTMPTAPTTPNFTPSSFQERQFTNQAANQYHDEHEPAAPALHGKDLEIIGAKLDAIRSQLDMLNLRISTLEQRLPQQENANPKKPWY